MKVMKVKNNMVEDLNQKLEYLKKDRMFRRVNSSHPIDIFIGYDDDGRATMSVKENGKNKKVKSTKYIEATLTKNINQDMYLNFTLLDESMYSIFLRFCDDLIISSINVKKQNAINFMIDRWNIWRNIFKDKNTKVLTDKEIVGLIGELLFLEKLIKKIGEKNAIESWNGPNKTSKDFELEDSWYEIKTKNRTSLDITISSIEQLDSEINGYLVVNSIEKASSLNENSINLNKIVNRILNTLSNYDVKLKFMDKLLEIGYLECDYYDDINYTVLKTEIYLVEKDFPRMRESDLKDGIIGISYKIVIEMIKRFLYTGRDLDWISRNIN